MGKRGPKKKPGERTPSGQLSRAKQEATISVSQVRGSILARQIDGKWMTPFGVMAIVDKRVTDKQYAAGERFALAYEAYRAAVGSPGLSASAQDLNAVGGRDNVIENDADVRRARRAVAEWSRIEDMMSKLEMSALERICILHLPQDGYVQFRALIGALDKLVGMWGARLTT